MSLVEVCTRTLLNVGVREDHHKNDTYYTVHVTAVVTTIPNYVHLWDCIGMSEDRRELNEMYRYMLREWRLP